MQQYAARGVHGQTVEVLAQRILTGQLPEGATLDLTALQESSTSASPCCARRCGCSPPRAWSTPGPSAAPSCAPRRLEPARRRRAALAVRPGAGPALDDLHELRSIVEPGAASLAAARATDDDLAALDAALGDMAAAGDRRRRGGRRRPRLPPRAARRHPQRAAAADGGGDRDRPGRTRPHGARRAGTADPVPSHRAVVDAIRRRNPAQAARAMGKLLDQAIEDVARLEREAA
jgi:GntR family galactonate operon transcriptional repressor